MLLVDRDQCLQDLSHLLPETPIAFREAMRRMRNASPEDLIDRTARSGSNLTRDYAVAAIQRLWHGQNGVRVHDKGLRKLFLVNDKYAIRIKKFDQQSRSGNVRTGDDRRFRFQQPLEGIPRLIHLELGYVPNALRTDVQDVRLICLNGYRIYWTHSIERPDDDANVYDLFQGTPDPHHPQPAIRPKDQDDAARETVIIKPKKR